MRRVLRLMPVQGLKMRGHGLIALPESAMMHHGGLWRLSEGQTPPGIERSGQSETLRRL